MKRISLFAVLCLTGLAACTSGPAGPSPSQVAAGLAKDAPATEHASLTAAAERLKAAEDAGRITEAQRDALGSLYDSAQRDGKISDDERDLLTSMVAELAAPK